MNNLILGRTEFPGEYIAEINIEGEFFCALGNSYQEVIDRLLLKIAWYFHGIQ